MDSSDVLSPDYRRDLGNGLILRYGVPSDAEAVSLFNSRIHSDKGEEMPDKPIEAWTRDLFAGNHPTFRPQDFTIVEDTQSGTIVSSCSLIRQTWSYAEIPFGVGRVELVGTHRDYRRRGLIRQQIDLLHQCSAESGDLMQAITGIPNYYRQFGYAMSVSLSGTRSGFRPAVPNLPAETEEPYRIRPATAEDIPFIAACYNSGCNRHLLRCQRDADMWHYELSGRRAESAMFRHFQIIETPLGEQVGVFAHMATLWGSAVGVTFYELAPGHPWRTVTASVLRYLRATGIAYAERDSKPEAKKEWEMFAFNLGADHPVYQALQDWLPRKRPPYAWYIRVANVRGFLEHIGPVLERRLANSIWAGYSGALTLNMYHSACKLVFEQGHIRTEDWTPKSHDDGDAHFPDYTFLNVLLGHRSADEIGYIFPDSWVSEPLIGLVDTLFPKQNTNLWPIA